MNLLSEKLRIPPLYIRKTQLKDVYVAALPQQWCLYIKKNLRLPDEFEYHATYSLDEVQAFLWDSESLLGPDWLLVYINVIPKCNHQVLSTYSTNSDTGLDFKDLTYSQYLHYVSQTNFKNLWKESQKKFPDAYRAFALNRGRRNNPKNSSWQESFCSLLSRVFTCPIISLETGSVLHHTNQSHSCFLQAVGIFECSSNFFVITEHIPHSVHQCLSLSPALLNSNSVKPMFLLFQTLYAIKEMHDRSLFIEGVLWQQFFINESLSLKVLPALASSLIPVEPTQSMKQEPSLQELTTSWVRGCLSNYDYLMALNDLAGRQIGNPFNHPVLPWISDLSSPFGSWRDLTKSKFRLNKGDRQLDLTFDPTTFESPEGKEDVLTTQVPHHITDVLSEITYYVYLARQTARSVLCRYVRSNWNPLEYPTSIERMQQWTPDECIPQFFSDPTVFKSIHDDLPDLNYPPWASSAEDFITKHRNALESPYVSERLHQWIDLTFGFRLSGSAAIKAKNVHLSLVDLHVNLSTRGVIQLFSQPHPRKLLPSPYVGRSPPRLPPAEEQLLTLPLDYNPVGLLRQLETLSHFHGPSQTDSHDLTAITVAGRRQRDLQWLVTLAMELFIPQRFRLLRLNATLEERWQICQDIIRFDRHLVPRCLRAFIQTVFQNDTVTAQGLPPPSAHQLLQPMVSLIPFPTEFPAVLKATHKLKQLFDHVNVDFPDAGRIISSFSNSSSIALLIPFVKTLLLKSSTAFRAALYLLDPIATALGPFETAKEFLHIILKIMGPETPSAPLVLLYHKRFLLMLQVRLGLRCFLQNISLLVVEGVGGCYNADAVTAIQQLLVAPSTLSLSPSLDRLKLGKEKEQESETELETSDVFTFEVGEEAALMEQACGEETGAISGTPSRTSVKYSLATAGYPVRDIYDLDECTVSQVSVDSLLWLAHRLGPVLTARYLTRNLLRMIALCYAEGNSLNLADSSQESSPFQISGALLQGDFNANRILGCLASIASLYGEQFVMLQYFPHAAEIVSRCIGSGTISIMLEGGLIGSCSLILACIPCLQDSNFMQCLREVLLRQLLDPIISTVTSSEQIFARGGPARSALAIKLLDCLCAVSIRLGTDAAGEVISEPALKLLKSFNRVSKVASSSTVSRTTVKGRPDYMCHQRRLSNTLRQAQAAAEIEAASPSPSNTMTRPAANEALSLAEMAATFTDHFAFQLLTALNLILGVRHVQLLVEQGGQAAQACATQYASTKDTSEADSELASKRRTSVFSGLRVNRSFSSDVETTAGSSYGSRISVIGNRIQLFAEEEPVSETMTEQCDSRPTLEEAQEMLSYRKTDSSRHLRGNWLAYWEHEAGRADRDTRFNFKQIRLLQLNGHSAGIRSIHVMDSEIGLLTAGRDKTARVWSLHSQGDGNNCVSASYVYQQHRKPLLGVSFIDSARLAASCDGAVHLWDPFVGTSVRQLDASSSCKFPTVTAMKALPAQTVLVTATAEGTLRMLDTRAPLTYQQELRISPVAAGLVRCLATGSNGYWVAAGHSSGILSLMDTRTGMLLASWKGHEGEVLQVNGWTASNGSQHLISSSLDQSVSVWSADDGKLKFNFRGASEPVHCLCTTGGGELVTGTTANRIGVYTSLTSNANFSSTKLRSDTFKGVLTAMAVVPLNRMLLLGSDSGVVSLLC